MNSFGVHGSEYAEKSIFNDYGRFGGEYSLNSPWNRYSSTPPKVYLRERFVGFLTKNPVMTPRIDPDALVGLLKSSE